jgi:long-chain acyl-CoA synthetase
MSTVLHRLAQWADVNPNAPAQRYKAGGAWIGITAREYCDRIHYLAAFLESRGIDKSQVGAIVSYNCPQWVQMDLAVLLLGAKSAGLYPNSTSKDIHYILNHTEATVLSVQNKDYFKKITGENNEIPLPQAIRLIVVFNGDTSISPLAVSYEQALAEGKKLVESGKAKPLKDYLAKLQPNAGAFMIYTSGTTGNPKGALLSHDNLVYTADMASKYWGLPTGRGSLFSFLPLCHIAEKLQNIGVGISRQYTVNYCTQFERVAQELPEVQPTLLLCVPRLWEKMMEGVLNKVRNGKGLKKHLATWALKVGSQVAQAKYSGKTPSIAWTAQYRLADKLVLSKIRDALGLGKSELLASGAAALPAHVSQWFRSLGLENRPA